MSNQALERKLAEIEAARNCEDPIRAAAGVRKGLTDRNNFAVSKAAAAAAARRLDALVPDLIAAFERCLENPRKADPQCWAKNAIVRALAGLGHRDPGVYLRGSRHFQPEPVWGGQQDSASALREICALALVETTAGDFDILCRLADMLADPESAVRIAAARAIARMNRREGALALRVKALAGDSDPAVTGQCLAALAALTPDDALALVAGFLASGGPALRAEAAGALIEMHRTDALELFRAHWNRESAADVKRSMLALAGTSRLREATDFLLDAVRDEDEHLAIAAIGALAAGRFREASREHVASLVRTRGQARLGAAFAESFGGEP